MAHAFTYFPLWQGLPDAGTCASCAKRKMGKYCERCFHCEACATMLGACLPAEAGGEASRASTRASSALPRAGMYESALLSGAGGGGGNAARGAGKLGGIGEALQLGSLSDEPIQVHKDPCCANSLSNPCCSPLK